MNEWFTVGKIVNTHGIDGEVRVISETDFPEERFSENEKLYVGFDLNTQPEIVFVESHRKHKQFDLVRFKHFNNINDVKRFKGTNIYIRKDQLHELDEGAFYYHEIMGCDVYTEEGAHLGKIKEVLSPGANDVWVVKTKGKDLLLPYIEPVVKKVDINNKKVIVHLLDGLMDDEN